MLIHGRLILTASGLMLGEVRSLLQKSLRRKERGLVTKATKELIGRGKDQLPWKSIITFMFEDHCLNGEEVLLALIQRHKTKNKYGCIELMLEYCNTCRVAACLPIIGMDSDYEPVDWDCGVEVDEGLQNLVSKAGSRINFDLLLQHMRSSWKEKNVTHLISYIKLVTMVNDHDNRALTGKGLKYCYFTDKTKKPNPGMVVLTMLSKLSDELGNKAMERYCRYSCYLASVPDVPVRLILSAAVAQYIHHSDVKHHDVKPGKIIWREVGKLEAMPAWATDKHTFRGKCGKGTKHLLKKKPEAKNLTESELEEFHGDRPKRDIEYFFTEGVKCNDEVLSSNPYWDRCMELYLQRPKKLQKTIRMTAVYYTDLIKKYPDLKGKKSISPKSTVPAGDISKKRKADGSDTDESINFQRTTRKKLKIDPSEAGTSASYQPPSDTKAEDYVIQDLLSSDDPCLDGPLLQLPTGSAKMYTRVDIENRRVWKGPYRGERVSLVMFLHRVMNEVLNDPHTLKIQRKGQYVQFPLLCADGASMDITVRDFYDCIGKSQVTKGQFVKRESLGVVQGHNLGAASIRAMPASFWCHYLFRYMLNIGDSGLYNSIADDKLSFLYGIDMEEIRKNVMGHDLLNLMFVKLPKKELRDLIIFSLRRHQQAAMTIMSQQFDIGKIEALAKFYTVGFVKSQFQDRLGKVKRQLNKLKQIQ